jgi:hypothetical protein
MRPLILALVLAGLAACASNPTPRSLERLYFECQREHGPNIDPERLVDLAERRAARVAQVHEILETNERLSSQESLYAAVILLDSERREDLDLAGELALDAAEAGDERGFALAAEAIDRSLMVRGLPQRYGTQYVYMPVTETWSLYTWDPKTSDAEREAMGVPTLAEALERAEILNRPPSR